MRVFTIANSARFHLLRTCGYWASKRANATVKWVVQDRQREETCNMRLFTDDRAQWIMMNLFLIRLVRLGVRFTSAATWASALRNNSIGRRRRQWATSVLCTGRSTCILNHVVVVVEPNVKCDYMHTHLSAVTRLRNGSALSKCLSMWDALKSAAVFSAARRNCCWPIKRLHSNPLGSKSIAQLFRLHQC